MIVIRIVLLIMPCRHMPLLTFGGSHPLENKMLTESNPTITTIITIATITTITTMTTITAITIITTITTHRHARS